MLKLSHASIIIIPIAKPMMILTGKTSQKPIIGDRVRVVDNPIKKTIAKQVPMITITFLFIFAFPL